LFRDRARTGKKELVELWAGNGALIQEYWDNETYVIVIEQWTFDNKVREIVENLNRLLAKATYEQIKVIHKKVHIFDWS